MRVVRYGLGVVLLLSVFASGARAQTPSPPPVRDGVMAVVTGLRSDRGIVQISIYDGPQHWPGNTGMTLECRVPIANRQASCVFPGLHPGAMYAIALMHDENNNGHMDFNFIGMPQEGYGFSNDVHPLLSAPSFDSCRFAYRGGLQVVRMTAQY